MVVLRTSVMCATRVSCWPSGQGKRTTQRPSCKPLPDKGLQEGLCVVVLPCTLGRSPKVAQPDLDCIANQIIELISSVPESASKRKGTAVR